MKFLRGEISSRIIIASNGGRITDIFCRLYVAGLRSGPHVYAKVLITLVARTFSLNQSLLIVKMIKLIQ